MGCAHQPPFCPKLLDSLCSDEHARLSTAQIQCLTAQICRLAANCSPPGSTPQQECRGAGYCFASSSVPRRLNWVVENLAGSYLFTKAGKLGCCVKIGAPRAAPAVSSHCRQQLQAAANRAENWQHCFGHISAAWRPFPAFQGLAVVS